MSEYLQKFQFEKEPKSLEYKEGEPLKLSQEFRFYHNKNTFRKELNQLQTLFKTYTGVALMAAAIRDSYLKLEYTENYLIVLFTTADKVSETNSIVENYTDKEIEDSCFFVDSTSEYLILMAKDMKGLKSGVKIIRNVLDQILDYYVKRKEFDEFVKVKPFRLYSC